MERNGTDTGITVSLSTDCTECSREEEKGEKEVKLGPSSNVSEWLESDALHALGNGRSERSYVSAGFSTPASILADGLLPMPSTKCPVQFHMSCYR